MNKELTHKLVKRFPVLYQDFYSNMQVTAMCWGFDHGDGWFDIIWMLSLAIEDELNYSWWQKKMFLRKKAVAKWWNKLVYDISPVQRDKTKMIGKGTHEEPYKHVVVEKAKRNTIDIIFEKILYVVLFWEKNEAPIFVRKLRSGSGFKFFAWHPDTGHRVDQVKEKFGGLRYYCAGNDRIYHLIALAECMADATCENCGKYGKLYNDGWMRTLCDNCEALRHVPADVSE